MGTCPSLRAPRVVVWRPWHVCTVRASDPHASRAKLALVFASERGTPFSGWSKAKSALDAASGVCGWWLHDLRRTLATGLQRLGVRLEVTEAVLNHLSGSRAGVVGIYQRHIGQRRNAQHSTHGLRTFLPQGRCCHSAERAQARCSRGGSYPLAIVPNSAPVATGRAIGGAAPPTAGRGGARSRRRAEPTAWRRATTGCDLRAPPR
jgi:hypothetical protein